MKEKLDSWKKKFQAISRDYGKVIVVGLLILICIGLACVLSSLTTPGKLRISFLDIGQGDSIFIQTPSGHTMIVDGGPTDHVLERLSRTTNYFMHDIDVMVATHPDADHITGLIPVLEKYDVHTIVVSGSEGRTAVFADLNNHIDGEHADVHIANAGDVIDFHDGVTAKILHPYTGEHFKDTNDASVSMVVTYGGETFLLTGDLPGTREPLLTTNGLPKNITVYKAGHHGSKFSSGEQLLTYIRPEYAVISAGKDNRYGHPNPETITRLQKYAKEIISTIDRGTISFVTDGRTMGVETDR